MKELEYRYYEDINLFEPSDDEFDLHFSQIPKERRDNFAYIKGKVLSRNVNKKMVRFSEPALVQAEREFKASPFLIEHEKSLKDMIGTITNFQLNDNGLDYFSVIPKTKQNEHYITMLQNDVHGIIRTSIGGTTSSITCSICSKELFKDREHQYGKKYGGQLAFGNVNNWKTKEVSLTIFPADEDTTANVYQTGFSEIDKILLGENEEEGETLINEENNSESELNMTGEEDKDKVNGLTIEAVQELIQNSTPSLDGFATKEEISGLTTLLQSLIDKETAKEEALVTAKRLELSKLTGKEVAIYASMDSVALDLMIEGIKEIKGEEVPDEVGIVDHSQSFKGKNPKLTREMKLEAVRVILGVEDKSKRVDEHYGRYNTNYQDDIYDRVDKSIKLKFKDEDEDTGDK